MSSICGFSQWDAGVGKFTFKRIIVFPVTSITRIYHMGCLVTVTDWSCQFNTNCLRCAAITAHKLDCKYLFNWNLYTFEKVTRFSHSGKKIYENCTGIYENRIAIQNAASNHSHSSESRVEIQFSFSFDP